MASKGRRALLRGLRRPVGKRLPRARFVLFCEGKNTEPDYFRCLGKIVKDALIAVEIVGASGTPKTIATKAVERKKQQLRQRRDSFEKNDRVWAIFDRDEHPFYEEAIALCEREGVDVGRSNPCFELWLILHIQDYDKACDRHEVQDYLGKIHAPYKADKRKLVDAVALLSSVESAEVRGAKQCQRRAEERASFGAPSTTVYLLTRAIREAANRSRRKPR
ncbi:MAG: RloB domain-containing protein [Reyranella sp.]|nr:RloB domain-containing protein [Reyranella sp.]